MSAITPPAAVEPAAGASGRTVVILGWVSFCGGLSQDMILPILPAFLAGALGLSKASIGLIEGTLNAVVSLLKLLSGVIADRTQRRKALVLTGYALSAAARPALALAGTGGAALGLRALDGAGKGLKDAPRDALIAGAARAGRTGWAFGLHRLLDTAGSVVGPLATAGLLLALGTGDGALRLIFLLAGLPALLAVLLVLLVRERVAGRLAGPWPSLTSLRGDFAVFLGIVLIFALGNSSDAFLLLRAQDLGVSLLALPVVYALFNLCYAGLALPAGALSDRLGRRGVLLLAWAIYGLTYLGFAAATAAWQAWALYALYGLYYAAGEGTAKALVADVVEPDRRGTAYGLYNAAVGLMALPASLLAGWLWDAYGAGAPFAAGAGLALAAAALLATLRPGDAGA